MRQEQGQLDHSQNHATETVRGGHRECRRGTGPRLDPPLPWGSMDASSTRLLPLREVMGALAAAATATAHHQGLLPEILTNTDAYGTEESGLVKSTWLSRRGLIHHVVIQRPGQLHLIVKV